jgi:hypothetical protein
MFLDRQDFTPITVEQCFSELELMKGTALWLTIYSALSRAVQVRISDLSNPRLKTFVTAAEEFVAVDLSGAELKSANKSSTPGQIVQIYTIRRGNEFVTLSTAQVFR